MVLRPADDAPQQRMAGLLEEYERTGISVACWTGTGPARPGSLDYPAERAAERCAAGLGVAVRCATAHRSRERIASGYEEATDVLTLASAAGRRPGVFRLNDFLIEYAVLRQSAVVDSLLAIVKPLLANDMLRRTLAALIESDFNRNLAAQALFIHRSTLDYRIRRIEEVTGHNPMSGRGAQVLSAAMTASTVAEVIRRRGMGIPMPTP
ncbi:CdaR family transcriptional regulator [Kutzneria sp. 744]|uniref:PucR family transcriptional regulator n=1 Tax=Kutzneria sp. (strain 744) TaxID=345341 RepID=UPI0003EED757|nr:helix-turn-helix domain-containing protein [Kutzneria sp. 744]EWM19115.1 transcriptional regulator [Kutzneria sp. 744]